MRLRRLTMSFIRESGRILPREVFIVVSQNPAALGKHHSHPSQPLRGLYNFLVHTSTKHNLEMKTTTKKRNRKSQGCIVIPLTKRNFPLWFPILAMADERLPLKADSTSLELSLRVV